MVSTGDQLSIEATDLQVRRLGKPVVASPMARLLHGRTSSPHYVHESDRVLLDDTAGMAVARSCQVGELPSLEPGGPREYIYFDPASTRVGVVTCGGLCPGLNNVIRGGRCAEDDRQRHSLHRPQLRLPDRVRSRH